jgi:hypothetical protein
MTMPSTIVGGGPAGSSRRQRGDRAGGGDAEQVGEHGLQVSVAGRCTAGVRGALGVPSFRSCSPACDDLRRRAGHLAIARLAEADSQVRRPALRIVLPGCSIRDQGRWVCAFRRDGSPAALVDAGGSAPRRRRPGCSADFMDIPSPPIRGPPRNERGSHCRPRRGCPWPAGTRCQLLAPIPGWRRS